jgi:hypothetical protein
MTDAGLQTIGNSRCNRDEKKCQSIGKRRNDGSFIVMSDPTDMRQS